MINDFQFHLRRCLAPWIAALLAGSLSGGAPIPSRATIEKHVDPTINVHGKYAAVRLPISRGVTLWNPTAVKVGDDGTLFVANYPGQIIRLVDTDGDGLEDSAELFADVRQDGLLFATSLAIRGREVFVATTQEIRVYTDSDGDGVADQSRTFAKGWTFGNTPADWVFGLVFDRDGWLNFSLATDAYNSTPVPDPDRMRGCLLRVSPDGTKMEKVANGLRNAFGAALNPNGDLFFSDNKGDGNPTEEINLVKRDAFYGHNPDKFPGHPPTTPPLVRVRFGYGLVGMTFNPVTNDFGGTAGDMFVGAFGPDFLWDRGSILRVRLERNREGTYRAEEFPFAHEVPKMGDVAFGPQGDLYAASFGKEGQGHLPYGKPSGAMYRFIHAPWYTPPAPHSPYPKIQGDIAHGRQVFEALACATCHAVGGKEELLGPDLEGIGEMFSEAEILDAIVRPSAAIKTGHETVEATLRGGETVLGRVSRSGDDGIAVILAGNTRRFLPRADIVTNRLLATSLMPEGLLAASTPRDIEDLLAYLGVRRPTRWQQATATTKVRFRHWRTTTTKTVKLIEIALVLAAGSGVGFALLKVARRRSRLVGADTPRVMGKATHV